MGCFCLRIGTCSLLEKPFWSICHLNPDRVLNEIGSQLGECFMDGIAESGYAHHQIWPNQGADLIAVP